MDDGISEEGADEARSDDNEEGAGEEMYDSRTYTEPPLDPVQLNNLVGECHQLNR